MNGFKQHTGYDEESLSSRHVVQTVVLSNNLLHSNNSSFDKQFMSLFSIKWLLEQEMRV